MCTHTCRGLKCVSMLQHHAQLKKKEQLTFILHFRACNGALLVYMFMPVHVHVRGYVVFFDGWLGSFDFDDLFESWRWCIFPWAMTRVCVLVFPLCLFFPLYSSWWFGNLTTHKMGPQVCADECVVRSTHPPTHTPQLQNNFAHALPTINLLQPFHVMCKPIHSLVDSFVCCCCGCLQMNLSSLAQSLDLKYFGKFITGHSIG